MAKRGPKTQAGKEAVRFNAAQHGILSESPVIRGFEREEEWEELRLGVMASLASDGKLESVLAERIALLLWRLRRVSRYETEVIAVSQGRLEEPESVQAARADLDRAQSHLRLVERLPKLPADERISGSDAVAYILGHVENITGVNLDDILLPDPLEDLEYDDLELFDGWTVGLLRDTISALADEADFKAPRLLKAVADKHRGFVRARQEKLDRAMTEADFNRRERLLPDEDTLNKLMRYEAHLNRQLIQNLHEHEALQARRQGGVAPLARLDVQGLSDA